MYYKHLNGFSRAPGNGKSCWSVGDTKISFLNTLAENGPFTDKQNTKLHPHIPGAKMIESRIVRLL